MLTFVALLQVRSKGVDACQLRIHPDALLEYAEAATYYFHQASPQVAAKFVTAVESAIRTLASNPERWRVMETPDIRRCVFSKFPFAIYYRWEAPHERVTIYAVMHCSREPGYWRNRLATKGE